MAARSSRRRRSGGQDNDGEADRWLLTYADMITLLMALFMVLFSISAVDKAKFDTLQRALKEAFSAKLLPGGEAIAKTGASSEDNRPTPTEPAIAQITITSRTPEANGKAAHNARREEDDFQRLKRQVDAYAATHGLATKLVTTVAQRGLIIRVLDDRVLFDSGRAQVKATGAPVLGKLATLLRAEVRHPILVEGHTDNVPISGGPYPSNWELSTARASSVVRSFVRGRVNPHRLTPTGYANFKPLTTNATSTGRAANRRVEIVLVRMNAGGQDGRRNPAPKEGTPSP